MKLSNWLFEARVPKIFKARLGSKLRNYGSDRRLKNKGPDFIIGGRAPGLSSPRTTSYVHPELARKSENLWPYFTMVDSLSKCQQCSLRWWNDLFHLFLLLLLTFWILYHWKVKQYSIYHSLFIAALCRALFCGSFFHQIHFYFLHSGPFHTLYFLMTSYCSSCKNTRISNVGFTSNFGRLLLRNIRLTNLSLGFCLSIEM